MSMILIQRQVLSSSASSVTFSNIPQNYRTLVLACSARSDNNGVGEYQVLSFNNSTSSYSARELIGNGSTAISANYTSGAASRIAGYANGNTTTTSTFGNSAILIPNYSGSSNKAWSSDGVSENNGTISAQSFIAGIWSNTSAITSILVSPFAGANWLANSSFSLYGLL